MRINLIAALAKNRVIGHGNKMPWHLPADFAWFRKHTLGHPVIMGRNTFESIGKPLPGRRNIVLSRNAAWHPQGCDVFATLEDALESCRDAANVFVIGGATLYQQLMSRADRLYLTEVDASPPGDAWFPELVPGVWREIARERREADEKNMHAMEFVILDRMRG